MSSAVLTRETPAFAARRRPRLTLLHVVPAAIVLAAGIAQLARQLPLWYDEEYTRIAAGVPLSTLAAGVWNRVGVIHYLMDVPPSFNAPYYAFMHVWVQLVGSGDLALRTPSLVCGALAAGVLAEIARRRGGPAAGWVAGLLVATGRLYLDEVAQARPYGIALLCLALCVLWLDQWRETGRGRVRTAVAGGCAVLLHWFALPVLAALVVAAAFRRGHRRFAAVLAFAGLPAVALVGWSFAGGAPGAPQPPPVGWALTSDALVDWSGSGALAVVLTALALIGLARTRDPLLIAWILIPFALVTALELLRPSYFPRYLLFPLVGVMVAAGVGVGALRPRLGRPPLAAVLVGLSVLAAWPLLRMTVREPGPQAVAYLDQVQQAGQPIVPADGRTSLDLETSLADAPRLATDLVLPPELFTTQTTSHTVWLVRVVLHQGSLPVVPAEQRLIDSGWTQVASHQLHGSSTDLRIEQWTR